VSEKERRSRRERLEALRRAGVDPYPARVEPHHRIARVRERFDEKSAEELEGDPHTVAVCGRVVATRSFGKLLFLRVVEDGTPLQVTVRKGAAPEAVFRFARELDVGDVIRAEGPLWRTRTGELSVDARALTLLAKSLRPLPEKWHGLKDVEARLRRRYVDLLVNEDARRLAVLRSRIVTATRRFLDARGFLEVETPALQPLYGGAAARPFVTHHQSFGQDLFLRISDELYLKRLVVGGLDRVYEIAHDFRNEGISRKHSPEFTMMECYQAYADYRDMLDLTQELVQSVAREALGTTAIELGGRTVELAGTWPRVPLRDAIHEAVKVDILEAADLDSLREALRKVGHEPGPAPTWAKLVDDVFSEHVEPGLVEPTFIVDYPVDLSPLAKRKPEDPRLVERFEGFLGGVEIANAFTELNDPDDQRERMAGQARDREAGDEETQPLDEDYLAALEYGMPPTGGLGIGVDRLVMMLCDAPNIRETILFPHLRPRDGGDGEGAAGEEGDAG